MRCALTLGLYLACSCTLDTQPLHGSVSESTDRRVRDVEGPVWDPVEPVRTRNATAKRDAAMTQVGTSERGDASPSRDASTMPSASPRADASDGASGKAPITDAGAIVAMDSRPADGGARQTGDAGTVVPQTPADAGPPSMSSRDALLRVLAEHANANGADALVLRALISQLDTPFPVSSQSLRLLLSTAVTSFSCPDTESPDCTVICEYASESCLTCIADSQCREQLVVVCPGSLMGCWSNR